MKGPAPETDGVPAKRKGAAQMESRLKSKDDATAMTGLPAAMVFWSELTECADLQDARRPMTVWSGQKVSSAVMIQVDGSAKKVSSAATKQADGSAKKASSAVTKQVDDSA